MLLIDVKSRYDSEGWSKAMEMEFITLMWENIIGKEMQGVRLKFYGVQVNAPGMC